MDQQQDNNITIDKDQLVKIFANILLRNEGNKLTIEVMNGIIDSVKQEVAKIIIDE